MDTNEVLNKLIAELERLKDEYVDIAIDCHYGTVNANYVVDDLEQLLSLITSLQQEQPECIEKTARISSGLLSNFGTSTYVLDVDLTQDEMAKVAPFGLNSAKIKIKIVCE